MAFVDGFGNTQVRRWSSDQAQEFEEWDVLDNEDRFHDGRSRENLQGQSADDHSLF